LGYDGDPKELQTRMDSYEKNFYSHQESVRHPLEMVQKSIEGLTTAIAFFNGPQEEEPHWE